VRCDDVTLHTERFSAPVRAESANTDFDVVLAGSGEVVHVAADQSVLLALRGDGVTALSSCAEGLCGTCETPVLEGVPEHRDVVLTDEEKQRGESMRSVYCAARATVSCSTSEPVWRRGSRWAERQAASADCATPTISVWVIGGIRFRPTCAQARPRQCER
jgi:ferredoxin